MAAALRGRQKSADIISKDPVIAWLGAKKEGGGGREEEERERERYREGGEEGGNQERILQLPLHTHTYSDEADHETLKHTPTTAASLCCTRTERTSLYPHL